MKLQALKLWDVNATVIPIVAGALRTIIEELEKYLKTIRISIVISCFKKSALL